MKKIILTLVVSCLAIFGCTSSDDNNESSILKEKLIGSWKLVGYYDDQEDPETGSNYHLVDNGDVYKFSSDGNFDNVGDEINPDGSFSITIDSVLTRNFNENSLNPNSTYIDKINLLNEEYLEHSCYQNGAMCDTYRYQKVTP